MRSPIIENSQNRAMAMNIIRETERVKVVVSCKLMSFANLRLLDLSVHWDKFLMMTCFCNCSSCYVQ